MPVIIETGIFIRFRRRQTFINACLCVVLIRMIVVSVGGSLINPNKVDNDFLQRLKNLVESRKEKFIIITGGGAPAREYISAAKKLNLSQDSQDWVGIAATMLNGELVRHLFDAPKVLQAPKYVEFDKVLVAAGWKPGWSTDYDAVLWAKEFGVKLVVNLSNTDYVYSKDPKKFKDAKPLKRLKWSDYKKMIASEWTAGLSAPFDPVATRAAEELELKVAVINGHKLEEFEKCLDDKEFVGTVLG